MFPTTAKYFVPFLFFILIDSKLHDSVGCNFDEFSCKNGQCISKLGWCDGIKNCIDNSDEDYCLQERYSDPNHCSGNPSLFLCNDGRCIPTEGQCDGMISCEDWSDEVLCDPTTETFTELSLTSEFEENKFQQNLKFNQNAINYSRKYNYFSDFQYGHNKDNLKSARSWLLSQWDTESGWGADTARAIIALQLSKTGDFDRSEQSILMNKQLDVQLFVALTRNSSKALSLCELSHYINALSASCRNPRDFNGYDLVSVLRDRVDALNRKHAFVTPYVYLTLCLHNFTKYDDFFNMRNILRSNLSIKYNFDMLSLSVLFVSCAIKTSSWHDPNFRTNMVAQLIDKINGSGIPKNVYELSLVVQALTEAEVDPSRWYREEAMDYIINSQNETGSFGDFLATYYTIPILSGRSMLDLSSHCAVKFQKDFHHNSYKNSKINVGYSLYFGYPVEITQNIQLQVTEGSSFLDIMTLAQEENPYFRFQLDESEDIPFVYSIGGRPNDAELGIYWTLYFDSSFNRGDLVPIGDIRHHIPKDKEEIVFWLRPKFK